jgi:hypothetical protein
MSQRVIQSAAMDPFVTALRKAREEAGYGSTRAFYNGRGGAKFFGCTYRQYLNVESGKTRPGPRLIEKIVTGLSLAYRKKTAREFFEGYLRSVSGSEEVAKLIVAVLSQTPEQLEKAKSPLVDSMAQLHNERLVNLTADETAIIVKDEVHYWCFTMVTSDAGHWSDKQIAEKLEFPADKVKKALAALAKKGLILKDTKKLYYVEDPTQAINFPSKKVYTRGAQEPRKFRQAMAKRKGEELLNYGLFLRGSESSVRQYMNYLIDSVKGAEVCSTTKEGDDTFFFQIETAVKKVVKF